MRAPRLACLAFVALVALALSPRVAHAQAAAPAPADSAAPAGPHPDFDPNPPLGIFPTSSDALIDPRMARSWGAAPTRWFAATTFDIGFVYGRPRLSLGYGKPFTKWVGIDVNPIAASSGVGGYGGLRLEMAFFDLRVGSRYWFPFNRAYLDPRDSYDRLELERDFGQKGITLTHEAELDVSIPAGPGNILLRGSASYVTGVPDDKLVFESALHVIVDPPFVWRARAGYAVRFGKYSQHSMGLVGDVLHVPARDDSITVRAGPIVRVVLSRRVDVRGSFVTTVISPDRIGLVGGDFTELGVRYRWATEP
ncbi:MAG: hypothetical protein WKG00_29570 [Polyangiaceae bacterium]